MTSYIYCVTPSRTRTMDFCESYPIAVALVSSGSRGNRLLFYHRGQPPGHCGEAASKDIVSELPTRTLSEILAPSSLMVGRKFELNVDEWKFVGHPFSAQTVSFTTACNVIFVLQSYCSPGVVAAYDHLSHLIGSAITHEEQKCSYLNSQVAILMQLLEEADIPDPSADKFIQESTLAQSLHAVLRSLQTRNCHVRMKINDWSEVNTLMDFDSADVSDVERSTVNGSHVRSYSALLLLESCDSIDDSLPSSCNPALHRLLRALSPMKSLQVVSLDADIPLTQVLHFASHLIHWGKAMAIYPLSENNIYITSPLADTRLKSDLSQAFSEHFPAISLAEMLSNFSLPVSLGELNEVFSDERVIQKVAWLVQHQQITQLHTYIYIVPMASYEDSEGVQPPSPSSMSSGFGSERMYENTAAGTTTTVHSRSPDSGHADEARVHDSVESQMLQYLTREEQQSVLHTSAACDVEDLEQFARYFHGSHHLEEIMLIENISRSQLLTLIDKFSEVLVTCTLPEHSAALSPQCSSSSQ